MNAIATANFDEYSDDDLLNEIRKRLAICAASLVSLAEVVGPAIRRGLDLSFVKNPALIDVLRKIESRQIYPPLAEQFLNLKIFNKLKALPLDDQKKIAEGGKIELVVRRGDTFDVRLVDVSEMQPNQVRLVFDGQRIRSATEQTAILESVPQTEDDPFDDATVTVRIVMSVKKRKAVEKAAAKQGISVSEYINNRV